VGDDKKNGAYSLQDLGGSVERSVLAGPWVRDFAKLGLHFLMAAVVSFKAGGNPTPRMGSHWRLMKRGASQIKKTILFRGREIRSSKPRAADIAKDNGYCTF
jgi:hypothetical protein